MYKEYYKKLSPHRSSMPEPRRTKAKKGSMSPHRPMGKKGQTSNTNLIFLVLVDTSLYERDRTLKVTSVMNIRELRLFVDSERVLGGKLLNSKS
jgi:hypothetical protein